MRLRCPEKNCPIDVPDDMVGMRIRCPHCGATVIVDPKDRDRGDEQMQAGLPNMAIGSPVDKPKSDDRNRLEHQIYDGLPPLAVMMALRRERRSGPDIDEIATKYPMTEDDWKALSAFESVLVAVFSLRTTLIVGVLALLANLLLVLTSASRDAKEIPGPPIVSAILFMVLIVAGTCLMVILIGGRGLGDIKLSAWTSLLPWSAFGITLLATLGVALDVLMLLQSYQNTSTLLAFVALPFNAIAAFDSGKSAWRAGQGLDQIRPPEISHRLIDALKYLA